MTPIVWIDWVGVIGVWRSIREETPPDPADGERGGGAQNRKRMTMDMMMTMTSSVILMMMMMNILVSSDPGHQSGHRHLPAWQMGKLPEGEKHPSHGRVDNTAPHSSTL